jgi:hypothetical protein
MNTQGIATILVEPTFSSLSQSLHVFDCCIPTCIEHRTSSPQKVFVDVPKESQLNLDGMLSD